MSVPVDVYVYMSAVPVKARKGHQIIWIWDYKWLCVAQHGCWESSSALWKNSTHPALNHLSSLLVCFLSDCDPVRGKIESLYILTCIYLVVF